MFDGTHFMWGMHWLWWIGWILLVGGVVWAITRLQQDQSGPPSSVESRETPLDVLKRRYAKGELTTDEYEERKERLERDR